MVNVGSRDSLEQLTASHARLPLPSLLLKLPIKTMPSIAGAWFPLFPFKPLILNHLRPPWSGPPPGLWSLFSRLNTHQFLLQIPNSFCLWVLLPHPPRLVSVVIIPACHDCPTGTLPRVDMCTVWGDNTVLPARRSRHLQRLQELLRGNSAENYKIYFPGK